MVKILKYTGIFLATLILLGLIAIFCLATFVSPNRFKPMIADQIMKYTGRVVTIDGDLSWSFFPSLGVNIGHAILSNPADFKEKTFVEIGSATMSVKLLPLLNSRIQSDGITLKGMKLNLIKSANGKTSWTFDSNSSVAAKATGETNTQTLRKAAFGLAISGINISDASVTWMDEQTKQVIHFEKFNFHAQDVNLNEPFPISSDFDFSSTNPIFSGHAEMSSKITANVSKQIFSFRNLDFSAKVQQNKQDFKMSFTGEATANLLEETLTCKNLNAQLANLALNGEVNVNSMLTAPTATGHVKMQPFDLKKWLQNMGQDVTNVQTMKNVSGDLEFTAGKKATTARGSIKVDEAQANKIRLTNIDVPINFQNSVLTLAPMTANFYKGSLQSHVKVNVSSATPQISLDAKLNNIQMGDLSKDLNDVDSKIQMSGTANADLQVTTAGTGSDSIVKNLNGTSHFSITNGVLDGVNIGGMIDSAYALSKGKPLPPSGANQTNFGNLTGTAVIQNGVINNNDLVIDSPRFDTRGIGTINLVNQKIDYRLQTSVKQDFQEKKKDVLNLHGLPIPILITGSLSNPSIRLDTDMLLKLIAQQQIENMKQKTAEQIQKKINEKISGDAEKLLKGLIVH